MCLQWNALSTWLWRLTSACSFQSVMVDTSCAWDSCCKALAQALTHLPIKAGSRLEHYMYNGPFGSSLEVMAGEGLRARGPRLLSTSQLPGWKPCSLWVTACEVSRHAVGWLMPCTV